MARAGISRDTTLVFYGDRNNWWACYAFWVFQLFGHLNAKVMDGGRLKWEQEGRPMTEEVPNYSQVDYRATDRDDVTDRIFRDEVLKHMEVGGQLVDVRSTAEYTGERLHMEEYPNEGALRGGHIPGAKNIPWARAASPDDGTFLDSSALREILRRRAGTEPAAADRRLLPDRRAEQSHLVCAHLSAGLRQRAQLRRQLDRVGQPGERAGRAVGSVGRRDGHTAGTMPQLPKPLSALLDDLRLLDRSGRMQFLIETGARFDAVPDRIARRPFPDDHRVPRCESEAYVWAEPLNGTLKFYFAVENLQGVSAKAMAVILDETLSGRPLKEITSVPSDVVFEIFGRDVSMGKGQGLIGILDMVRGFAVSGSRRGAPAGREHRRCWRDDPAPRSRSRRAQGERSPTR